MPNTCVHARERCNLGTSAAVPKLAGFLLQPSHIFRLRLTAPCAWPQLPHHRLIPSAAVPKLACFLLQPSHNITNQSPLENKRGDLEHGKPTEKMLCNALTTSSHWFLLRTTSNISVVFTPRDCLNSGPASL
jgi:hypothetical protein